MNASQATNEIIEAVDAMVTSYRTDFKHDVKYAGEIGSIPFLHAAHSTGTHMIAFPPADSDLYPPHGVRVPYLFGHADRKHILKGVLDVVKWLVNERGYVLNGWVMHFYNGLTWKPITADKALQHARYYVAGVIETWESSDSCQAVG